MARVLVPNGCRGVDGPNGEVYRPRNGVINIPGRYGDEAARVLGRAADCSFTLATAPSVTCAGCGRENWAWVEACPKCGAAA